MIQIQNSQVFSTDGKFVHRLGTNIYFKRGTTTLTDTVDNFEEVNEIPQTEIDEPTRSRRIEQLIRLRYSISDELAILRQRDTKPDEFAEYNDYAEQCKIEVDSNS